ncbi:MAG: hypothetical protein US70_C0032G0005 [Parcubacteria group bacterium GW2011_GWD2_38_11]|nr:MAG: hypothetical protein US70_C0032G0005 [Parcubacteria group bacterium GW2011_GWD2_38_11]
MTKFEYIRFQIILTHIKILSTPLEKCTEKLLALVLSFSIKTFYCIYYTCHFSNGVNPFRNYKKSPYGLNSALKYFYNIYLIYLRIFTSKSFSSLFVMANITSSISFPVNVRSCAPRIIWKAKLEVSSAKSIASKRSTSCTRSLPAD